MIGAGLSTEQGPPIHVPFRFFFTAPLFVLMGSAFLFQDGPILFSTRLNAATFGVTHLFALGFVAMVMIGAIFQMMPVIGGIPVRNARSLSSLVYLLFVPGVALFSGGFLFESSLLIATGSMMAFLGLLIFAFAVLYTIGSSRLQNHTIRSMRHSLVSLVMGIVIGLLLAGAHGGLWNIESHQSLSRIHIAFVLVGWILILITGVSFQVLPMFFVSPEYPVWMKKYLTAFFLGILVFYGMLVFFEESILARILELAFAGGVLLFAAATEYLFQKRMRKLFDPTIWYFRTGMISLVFSVLLQFLLEWRVLSSGASIWGVVLGALYLYGFAGSLIYGMLAKIIPFLVWFHLTSSGTGNVPSMKEMVYDVPVKLQLLFHGIGVFSLLLIPFFLMESFFIAIPISLTAILFLINYSGVIILYIRKSRGSGVFPEPQ